MFNRKKEQKTSKIQEEIGLMWAKIVKLEAQIDAVEQKFNSLNGRVNRKLGNETEVTEKSKYSDPFDSLRRNGIS